MSSKIELIIIADESLKSVKNAYGGANKKFRDLLNMNFSRDYQPDVVGDIADAKDGSVCQVCKEGKLRLKKGFEWGHCFKIDHFYTKPQEGYFTDKNGQKKLLWMGSYGIGMGRSMASIVETHHDEKGIIWPRAVAPYQAYLIAVDSSSKKRANEVYAELLKAGSEILWDDREDVSAGVKFADADLIGIPVRLVISQKTGEKIEWKERTEKQITLLTLDQVLKKLI